MHRHPWRRLAAWLIDWMLVLAWAAVVAAVGVPLYLTGVTHVVDPITLNVVAALTMVVPVTLALAWLESGGGHATLGKRALGIRVVAADTGSRSHSRSRRRGAESRDALAPDRPAASIAKDPTANGRIAFGAVTVRQVTFRTALLRNALKIALPWLLGHAAVFALVGTSGSTASAHATPPASVWILTVAAYVLPIVYVVSLFVRSGATPYDLAARTAVVPARAAAVPADG